MNGTSPFLKGLDKGFLSKQGKNIIMKLILIVLQDVIDTYKTFQNQKQDSRFPEPETYTTNTLFTHYHKTKLKTNPNTCLYFVVVFVVVG